MIMTANKYYEIKTDLKPPIAKYIGIRLEDKRCVFISQEVGISLEHLKLNLWLLNVGEKARIDMDKIIAYSKDSKDENDIKFFFKEEEEIYRRIPIKEKYKLQIKSSYL